HGQKIRIDYRACRSTTALHTMTARTVSLISNGPFHRISSAKLTCTAVARHLLPLEVIWSRPFGSNTGNQQLDLLIGKTSPSLLREGGHICSSSTFRDYLLQCDVRYE